jgi:proline iminopeptidase
MKKFPNTPNGLSMGSALIPLILKVAFLLSTLTLWGQPNTLQAGEGLVEVVGGKVWYRVIGSGTAAPMIMMHGGPGGTSYGLMTLGDLSANRPLVFFDQLGGGRSTVHQDTTLLTADHFVDQVAALVRHLDLDSFYLYGHSWGTALALEYYLKFPNGVKGIVFNSPFFNTKEWIADADTLIAALGDSLSAIIRKYEAAADYEHPDFRAAERVYLQHYGRRQQHKIKSKWMMPYQPGSSFIYTFMWGQTEFTATGTLRDYDRTDALRLIQVPALFVTGEFDEARPPTVSRQAQKAPLGVFAVIPNAGHATMYDNLEENVRVILEFLNGELRARPTQPLPVHSRE